MNIFQKPKVTTLSEWLEVATKKLEETAKERIRKEIEAHYADAVQAHCQQGLTEIAAQTAALEDLGEARSAARRFRNEYLTAKEAESLDRAKKAGRNAMWLLYSYFAFFILVLRGFSGGVSKSMAEHHLPQFYLILEILFLLVLPTVCFILAQSDRKLSRHLVLMQPTGNLAWAVVLGQWLSRDHNWNLMDVILLFALAGYLLTLIRLWNKLGNTPRFHDENPPSKTVSL